jgi:hypothetical protein
MKLYITAIVLLSLGQYAVADTTLEFKNLYNPGKQDSILYQIKDQKLRFTESGSTRVNLFDSKNQQFITFAPGTGKAEMFNSEVLDTRVAQLNQKRMLKLSHVEKELKDKLKNMSAKEQEVGESIVNQLKFPEHYGEHTLLSVNALASIKKVGGVECKIYQLIKKKQRLKEYCIASPSSLEMSSSDYQTLRSFYTFDYNMLTRLMLAMGKSGFELVDYDKEDMQGVVIEVISFKGDSIMQHQMLTSFNNNTLDKGIYDLPKR